jgi:site-specific DNA recombinase
MCVVRATNQKTMKTTKKQINYRAYSRKSSEAEDRQTLSIDSQIDALKKLASINEITLKAEDFLPESHSAKTAFTRPVFEQLIKHIEQGTAQGILVWHPNRLSRNAVDAARLIELMDQGKLIEIITPSQTFRDTPQDKFFFQLMTSQAKMENDAKGIDVKRGLRKKNEMGFPGGMAKLGYLNDYGKKGDCKIKVDPERFGLVKQLLEMFLTRKHSVRSLLKHADEEMGFRTIQRNKEGGKPLGLSRIYSILKDPFNAGFFYAKDEQGEIIRYEVNKSLPRMITESQYWEIQAMLGGKGRSRPSTNKKTFPYTGITKCGACNSTVTAEHKYQLICSECRLKFSYKNKTHCPRCETFIEAMKNPTYLHYIYYHCTKRKNTDCVERSVWEEDIDKSLASYFEASLKISPDLRDWCLNHFDELDKQEKENEYEVKQSLEKAIAKSEKEFEGLVDMRSKNLLDDEDFIRLQMVKKAEMARLRESLSELGHVDAEAMKRVREAFDLAVGIAEIFKSGEFEEKQGALLDTRSNLTLKDKKINVQHDKLFSIIIRGYLAAKSENKTFEPANWGTDKRKNTNLEIDVPSWLGSWDSNPGPIGYTLP